MCDSNKDIVSPSDTSPSRHDIEASGKGKVDEESKDKDKQMVEYLRQRLATVVAAGIPPDPDAEIIERSHFSMDLDDESGMEDWSG